MTPPFSKSLQNLVKDTILVEALKVHFNEVIEEVRPKADDIQKLPDAIIGAQTRAFLTARSVVDVAFKKLCDYDTSDDVKLDDSAGL